MALPRKNRLTKKKDIDTVFKEGNAVKGNFLFIRYKQISAPGPHLSFIVSKKVAGSAVERNRLRRILAETIRKNIQNFKKGYEVAIVSKKNGEENLMIAEMLKLLNGRLFYDEVNSNKNN